MAKKQDLSARIDESGGYLVECGDCRDVMRLMESESVDSIVSDPPYGIDFMGKGWDHGVPSVEFWKEALRVAKQGSYLLAFGGTRTFHRLAVAIEDSGWEIRDTIMWVYGSGFPKSHNIGKAIEAQVVTGSSSPKAQRKAAMGNKYKPTPLAGTPNYGTTGNFVNKDTGSTPLQVSCIEAKQWEGWGTALKPAWEPIIVARKPIIGTVAENVLKHGTGGMNIDACRVEGGDPENTKRFGKSYGDANSTTFGQIKHAVVGGSTLGRFPANLIHDGSDEVVALFPDTKPSKSNPRNNAEFKSVAKGKELEHTTFGHDDNGGSAARFFYCAKANQKDRNEGCDDLVPKPAFEYGSIKKSEGRTGVNTPRANNHPTVKPTDLMRYLCRLVTQPNGIVLDPFMGSGSTGKAAVLEGFRFMGIDLNEEYCTIAKSRIKSVGIANPKLETPMVENNPKNEGMLF